MQVRSDKFLPVLGHAVELYDIVYEGADAGRAARLHSYRLGLNRVFTESHFTAGLEAS